MRNARTDFLGDQATEQFKKSGLTVAGFIQDMVKNHEAFDTRENAFHTIDQDDIMSYYFANGRWFAKY